MIRHYWKWDEKFNDTPYKLGADIEDLLQKKLVCPSTANPNNFLGNGEHAPRYVEVANRLDGKKVNLILFSPAKKSTLPSIAKGLWTMPKKDCIAVLNRCLRKIKRPRSGDHLLVVFRGELVKIAILSRD